ncbi:MAG: hypothetical protein NTV22_18735 [bacterium]|nr:hypothetical protein [bacterium]
MKQIVLMCLAAVCCAFLAQAGTIPLLNPGFETGNAASWFSPQAGLPGVVPHATYPHANNETLGTYFAYYSAGDFATSWCGQKTGTNFVANNRYTLAAWMSNGGSASGFLDIGYCATPGDLSTFTSLTSATYAITVPWAQYSLVYDAPLSAAGKEVCVRFPTKTGNTGGTWVDQMSLEVVPEPALGLCALGLLALLRRR